MLHTRYADRGGHNQSYVGLYRDFKVKVLFEKASRRLYEGFVIPVKSDV